MVEQGPLPTGGFADDSMDLGNGDPLKGSTDTYKHLKNPRNSGLEKSDLGGSLSQSGYMQTFTEDETSTGRPGRPKKVIINKREQEGKACCNAGKCTIF